MGPDSDVAEAKSVRLKEEIAGLRRQMQRHLQHLYYRVRGSQAVTWSPREGERDAGAVRTHLSQGRA